MKKIHRFFRWAPSLAMMLLIFTASSFPAQELPSFGFWDVVVKKSGHFIGYGILTFLIWYGLRFKKNKVWLALFIAVLYALTDELHQAFVPGRHPSLVDVLFFDATGAVSALLVGKMFLKQKPGKND